MPDNQFCAPASDRSDTAVRGGGIVKRLEGIFLLLLYFFLGVSALFAQAQPSPNQSPSPNLTRAPAEIILPPGTRIELNLIRALWAVSAKSGDQVYAEVSFPVVAAGSVAIPAGVYVQGEVTDVTRPTRRSNRAEIDVLFSKIIFANGYTVVLPGGGDPPVSSSAAAEAVPGASLSAIKVQASLRNDLLLDNGAQVELTLESSLALNAARVAASLPLERAPQPSQFQSASRCRYIPGSPGTPGTSDTVIPGTPGTPSQTIPGGPGMPDTVIPGTPGTPPTVIPGTPGTPGSPGIACPPAPLVLSSDPITPKNAAKNQPPTSQLMGTN
jgi:hypothetical protein